MTSRKEVKKLIKKLEAQGFAVHKAHAGHWHVRNQQGHLVGTIPSTPGEYRGLKNQLARLKRAGFRP